jgi:hypothetical protein
MRRLASSFAVEMFDHDSARSDRLAEFMMIYVRHFGPEYRTQPLELLDFLASPPSDRTITYFGLTYRGQPCGFATFMYYSAGPIGIVDHIVVAPNLRGYGAFFSFCDLIAADLEARQIPFDHIVAEVMLKERNVVSTIKPRVLLRLLRLVGFRVAKLRYWAPDSSIVSDIDGCSAALLFASQPERDELPVAEFLRLVELVYGVHYAAWYKRTMTPKMFRTYKAVANGLLRKISASVAAERRVILNGMRDLDLPFSLDPRPSPTPSALVYISMITIPMTVGLSVALAQELWVTIAAAAVAIIFIAVFAAHPKLRKPLLKAFRLAE